jgi:hypothetical protein
LAEVIRDKEEGRHLEELAAGGGKTKKAAKVSSNEFVQQQQQQQQVKVSNMVASHVTNRAMAPST